MIATTRPRVLLGIVMVGGIVAALFGSPTPLKAHGGGLDAYGGHRNNKAGNYHSHRGPCAGMTFASKEAMIGAACNKAKK